MPALDILDILVKYGVGDKSAWGDLVSFVDAHRDDDIIALLGVGEEEYKKQLPAALPDAYRSAKSVLRNALAYGVAIMHDDEPLRKTAVEKATKTIKASSKLDTLDDRQNTLLDCMLKMQKCLLTADSDDQIVLKNFVEENIPMVWGY